MQNIIQGIYKGPSHDPKDLSNVSFLSFDDSSGASAPEKENGFLYDRGSSGRQQRNINKVI